MSYYFEQIIGVIPFVISYKNNSLILKKYYLYRECEIQEANNQTVMFMA